MKTEPMRVAMLVLRKVELWAMMKVLMMEESMDVMMAEMAFQWKDMKKVLKKAELWAMMVMKRVESMVLKKVAMWVY